MCADSVSVPGSCPDEGQTCAHKELILYVQHVHQVFQSHAETWYESVNHTRKHSPPRRHSDVQLTTMDEQCEPVAVHPNEASSRARAETLGFDLRLVHAWDC